MADLEKLLERRRQLDNRIKAEQKKRAAKERKRRTHALIVLGGFVESACGADWTDIDYARLDRVLHEHANELSQCVAGRRDSAEATAALRAYEAEKRALGKASAVADTPRDRRIDAEIDEAVGRYRAERDATNAGS